MRLHSTRIIRLAEKTRELRLSEGSASRDFYSANPGHPTPQALSNVCSQRRPEGTRSRDSLTVSCDSASGYPRSGGNSSHPPTASMVSCAAVFAEIKACHIPSDCIRKTEIN